MKKIRQTQGVSTNPGARLCIICYNINSVLMITVLFHFLNYNNKINTAVLYTMYTERTHTDISGPLSCDEEHLNIHEFSFTNCFIKN